MTSNGVHAPYTEAPPEPHQTLEESPPELTVTSLDYWRQMTERQIERLKGEIKSLEDQATPLRRQLTVLQAALSGVAVSAQPKRTTGHRSYVFNPDDAKNKGDDITDDQRQLIKQMVTMGNADTTAIRAAMPNVKSGQVYSTTYNERQKLLKEAKPR